MNTVHSKGAQRRAAKIANKGKPVAFEPPLHTRREGLHNEITAAFALSQRLGRAIDAMEKRGGQLAIDLANVDPGGQRFEDLESFLETVANDEDRAKIRLSVTESEELSGKIEAMVEEQSQADFKRREKLAELAFLEGLIDRDKLERTAINAADHLQRQVKKIKVGPLGRQLAERLLEDVAGLEEPYKRLAERMVRRVASETELLVIAQANQDKSGVVSATASLKALEEQRANFEALRSISFWSTVNETLQAWAAGTVEVALEALIQAGLNKAGL